MAVLTTTEITALQSAATNGTPATILNMSGWSTEQRNALTSAMTKLNFYVDQIDANRIAINSSLFQLLIDQTV